jgi:hypothetical protein
MAWLRMITVLIGLVSLCHVTMAANPTMTGTYKTTVPGQCEVRMKAYGYNDKGDKRSSLIIINGITYLDTFDNNPDYRGFNFVTYCPRTCRAMYFAHFDTNKDPAASDQLAGYLKGIPAGTHILGVTSDDAQENLKQSAVDALKTIGVDVSGIKYRDKVLFHAVKGYPAYTAVRPAQQGPTSVYYEENAATCDICQNGGYVKFNHDFTALYCACPPGFEGFFCERRIGC